MKMYEIEELKHSFAFKSVASFCQACLSSDRNLSSSGEYEDVLRSISNNIFPQPLLVCWECMAVLKKVKLFKQKLEEAQKILAYHYLNKEKVHLQTLSKLTKTYTNHAIITTHDDEEDNKQELEIKQENENSNDSFNNFEQNDLFEEDLCHQEIKKDDIGHQEIKNDDTGQKEIKTDDTCHLEIKKEKVVDTKLPSNKSLRYKIVYEKNAKKVLRKKIAIKPEDTKIWLDKEKNSSFFKKFKHKCELCVSGFKTKENLKKHILQYHETTGAFICPNCSIRFNNETLLSAHMQAHSFAWECARCGFQCYLEQRMNEHIKTHCKIQCLVCGATFQDLATFNTHYKTLHNVFICDQCGKKCKTKYLIEKHMRRHLIKHVCQTCSRQYKLRSSLDKHIKERHTVCAPEDAYCVLCNKQFVSVHVYRRHVLTSAAHYNERDGVKHKRFPCPECSNTYSRHTFMMNHYRHVHMNQSKYYCTECDKHFLNRTKLLDHVKYKHEGLKRVKNKLCNICGRGFAATRTLVNHMRTHTGERPYECEFCPSKFTQRTAMLTHVKYIHLKLKRRPQWQQ